MRLLSLLFNRVASRAALVTFVVVSNPVNADVKETYISDVSASSFTVTLVSDTMVVSPSAIVYSDDSGTAELNVDSEVLSSSLQHSLGLGVVRFKSLNPATNYFYRVSESDGSAPYFPITSPHGVQTLSSASNSMIEAVSSQNMLLRFKGAEANSLSFGEGSILLLSLAESSTDPVSAHVDASNTAYIDTNNFPAELDLLQGQSLKVTAIRGLRCPALMDHVQTLYRRSVDSSLVGTVVAAPDACDDVDTVCDSRVDVLDVQFVLNSLDSSPDDCSFSDDLDIVRDQQINVLDVQQVLNFF